jgi:hypothetical protein
MHICYSNRARGDHTLNEKCIMHVRVIIVHDQRAEKFFERKRKKKTTKYTYLGVSTKRSRYVGRVFQQD